MTFVTNLKDKRVLVTAASQGIGFGAAKAFVEEGARVVINSSNSDRLNAAVSRLRPLGSVQGVVADLRLQNSLDHLIEESRRILGGFDTFVYVTGSPAPGVFMDQDYDAWAHAAEMMVVSPAYLARRVAETMLEGRQSGQMVFLGSTSMREPIPTIATSSVCRIAVAGLVRTLARELGPKGIRVNGILPGSIQTQRIDELTKVIAARQGISQAAARAQLEREIPLGRVGTPEELARAVVFLGCDLSSYVTGALLPVDGGVLRSVY